MVNREEQIAAIKEIKEWVNKYTENAEQHQFIALFMLEKALVKELECFGNDPEYIMKDNEFKAMLKVAEKIGFQNEENLKAYLNSCYPGIMYLKGKGRR